ncbi:DUF3880 domain-containing protein [Ornithinibacillus salinisoli]|uniref:DUF3880 domain-containing protein n=1 Tax=Ornithinibacillus salinisoli TaxID=1848459 RepID=A0ABW4VY18_9BACI
MEKMLSERLTALSNEKKRYHKKLVELNSEITLNYLAAKHFEMNISSIKPSENIIIDKKNNGVLVTSTLENDEKKYFHFKDDRMDRVMEFLDSFRDHLIALSFDGKSKGCEVEFRLTVTDHEENTKEVRLHVGKTMVFRLDSLQQIKQLKMRILIKGTGFTYIRNPIFSVKRFGEFRTINHKKYSDLNIYSVQEDDIIQRFNTDINLIRFSAHNFSETVTNIRPDIFLCSSNLMLKNDPFNNTTLFEILSVGVERKIPTVFWDIEDPSYYSSLIDQAKYFDFVFTTNRESVERYKEDGCKNVYFLPFSVHLDFPDAIESYYIKDIVFVEGDSLNKSSHLLPEVKNDELAIKQKRLTSLRNILEHHTYRNKLETILDQININYDKENYSATMVAVIRSKQDYLEIMEQYVRQTMINKKLVLLIDFFEGYLDIFNQNNTGEIKTYLLDYIHHYDSINDLIETSHYAPISTKHYYARNYLKDMFLTTLYTRDSIIVKNVGEEYTFVTNGQFDQAFISKTFSKTIDPRQFVSLFGDNESHMLGKWFPFGIQFFNTDNFNLISDFKGNHRVKLDNIEI